MSIITVIETTTNKRSFTMDLDSAKSAGVFSRIDVYNGWIRLNGEDMYELDFTHFIKIGTGLYERISRWADNFNLKLSEDLGIEDVTFSVPVKYVEEVKELVNKFLNDRK